MASTFSCGSIRKKSVGSTPTQGPRDEGKWERRCSSLLPNLYNAGLLLHDFPLDLFWSLPRLTPYVISLTAPWLMPQPIADSSQFPSTTDLFPDTHIEVFHCLRDVSIRKSKKHRSVAPEAPGDTDSPVCMNTHAAAMLNKQGQNECQKGFSFVFSKGKRLSDCSN